MKQKFEVGKYVVCIKPHSPQSIYCTPFLAKISTYYGRQYSLEYVCRISGQTRKTVADNLQIKPVEKFPWLAADHIARSTEMIGYQNAN